MALGEQVNRLMNWVNKSILGDDVYVDDPIGVIDDGAGYTYPTDGGYALEPEYVEKPKRNKKVASLNSYKEHEIKVVEPRSFGDSSQIVKHLLENKTVMLNLHLLDKERAQRTIDFISGATYALDGSLHQIDDSVFVFTTRAVQLSVDSKQTEFGTEAIWGGNL